jgi:hypothetical protein
MHHNHNVITSAADNVAAVEDNRIKLTDKNTIMKNSIIKTSFLSLAIAALGFTSCSSDDDQVVDDIPGDDSLVINVEQSNFTGVTVTTVPCTLSDGTVTDCFQIITSSVPTDHQVGPWCPDNIADGADAGGIWLESGQVYDVDGAFVQNMATFYNDSNWLMYDANGDIFVTDTEQDCINAANPNVGAQYENFCVECLPSYITGLEQTWTIPITPVLQQTATLFATGPGGPPGGNSAPSTRGIALNGIEFSAPAPVDNILGAYTLAPFDDAGGHINVNQGYHYHAATGFSTEIAQSDGHAPLIGYALDGHGIYAMTNVDGTTATDLDALRGHTDDTRGYHYHVDAAGNNNFINGLKGAYAN